MPELGFQYELTRSDRRTLSIKISRDAKVLVYAPRRMSAKIFPIRSSREGNRDFSCSGASIR